MTRATLGLSAAAGILAALSIISAPPVQAHTALLGSTPADGDVLDALPSEVDLIFSEDLLPDAVKVSVANGDGTVVRIAAPTVDGPEVTFPWPGWPGGTAATDAWSINYRVVSQDGHPVSDTVTFTAPAPTAAAAVPSSTAPASVPSTVASDAAITSSPSADDAGPSPAVFVMIGAGLAAGIGVGLVLATRRRSTP